GSQFLQAARVLQYPQHTDPLCEAIADRFASDNIGLVVGPATGGIILAYATARYLGARSAFTEKDGQGGMAIKRGFALQPGERVLVVEDITTTGGSVKKTIAHLKERGAEIAGVSLLIDRSGGEAEQACAAVADCRFEPLASLDMESWTRETCPLCKRGLQLVEPDDLIV
ncbi:unnamed protein product, partial [marine sediment metagenome]